MTTYAHMILVAACGVLIGTAASFSGLGGGFLMVPLLLWLGYSAQKAVGTSFLAIAIIALSALAAHVRLGNVDWRIGMFLGVGGLVGAQVGALLLERIPTEDFRRVFAALLLGLALYLFFKR